MSIQLYLLLLFLLLIFLALILLISNVIKFILNLSVLTFLVIVVDDGSTDATVDIALRYAKQQKQDNPIYVLKLAENIGKGGSVRAGVLCARGRFILFSDADGATLFSDFSKLEKEMITLCNGEEEKNKGETSIDWTHPAIVVGSRAHLAEEAIAKRSFLRTMLMLAFHALVWVFTVRTVRDTQCGFKLFRYMDSGKKKAKGKSKDSLDDSEVYLRGIKDEIMSLEEEGVTYDPLPFADGQWNVDEYCSQIRLSVVSQSVDRLDLSFDLIKVEAPIANSLRRVLIAEVPTMAIEKVFLYQNTSCIQDEVLCHRLGLIPIYADPTKFAFPFSITTDGKQQINTDILDEEPAGDAKRNLIFNLHAVCPSSKDEKIKKKKSKSADGTDLGAGCVLENGDNGNWVLYTSAFKWVPIGSQRTQFSTDPPRMVHKDIILAKLRPGQEIEARCHCVKGIGRDHAKFSPVATATYRMLPQIKLKKRDFTDDQAKRLQSSFSNGVIGRDEKGRVYVKDARSDTSSRNIFMHDDLKDAVEMTKDKTHFIFTVESTGAMPAHQLVTEACEIMKDKVDYLLKQLEGKFAMIC
ncbi:RPOLD domain-containing protein [Meloidogyne graminicola]|uniref:RPOLD domain-containing protein n=1 Tax=Meloidogyne graminicola TaxID=189291 RepID=A0A8S9ZZM4_9BILA|nr:RPOLD domain-containing protein [Meloidogyne graminicola]